MSRNRKNRDKKRHGEKWAPPAIPTPAEPQVKRTWLAPLERVGPHDYVMAFGEYRGHAVREVPTPYLVWLQGTTNLSVPLREHIRAVVEARGHRPDGGDVMPFGRYYGYRFAEIQLGYLHWLVTEAQTPLLTDAHRDQIRAILTEANYQPETDPGRAAPPESPNPSAGPGAPTGYVPF